MRICLQFERIENKTVEAINLICRNKYVHTVKTVNSGYLRVLKNLSFVKRCPRLGGSLTKIVTFGTKHFVCYSRHARCLGCPLLRGFTVVLGAQLVICIAKNTLG